MVMNKTAMSVQELFAQMGISLPKAYAREHKDEFVKLITDKSKAEIGKAQRDSKRELEKAMQRVDKPDTIISKLYEDNIEGKISDEHL